MKAYSNKTKRVDSRVCLYCEINHAKRAMKKAVRFEAKLNIRKEI